MIAREDYLIGAGLHQKHAMLPAGQQAGVLLGADPLGLTSGDPERTFKLQTAEIKHGRLAMIAFLGKSLPHHNGSLLLLGSTDCFPAMKTQYTSHDRVTSWHRSWCWLTHKLVRWAVKLRLILALFPM